MAIGMLIGVTAALAAPKPNQYQVPQTGVIPTPSPSPTPAPISLSITIDGVAWTNGTAIDWGTNLAPGQPVTKAISFTNTGTSTVTSIVLSPDPANPLPNGWTEVISSLTTSLGPAQVASGIITLTPSASAGSGSYSWAVYIITS